MTDLKTLTIAGLVLLAATGVAFADDDDHEAHGHIDAVNQQANTVTLDHTTYRLTGSTEYGDDLDGFNDLRIGQSVEIEFHQDHGQRVADEVELDDND
ncbi:DUF5666 domain-containing protein [Salinisphaera hydrothermalis]|uniref:DUF5666 domain-containing protein n=1 Tax=Salinisphaera hydrothermalis TaxID=563188 RepID=UPI003341CA96